MFISDTLSRKPFKTTEGNENCREYTVFCIGNIPVSQEFMSKIRHETENDIVLIKLRETVLQDMLCGSSSRCHGLSAVCDCGIS